MSQNVYKVKTFIEKHNHTLVHKNDIQFLRAYRQLSYSQKQFIHQVGHVNLGPVRAFKLMKQIYGGFENVGATSVDCKNFGRDINIFIGDRDAQMAVEKLLSKKDYIPGFSVEYFTDVNNSLAGLFWADDEAKRNYSAFGDVISFDATFKSDKYKMVFVPFTGIDNHNRCVTFGAGLLAKENIDSYKWLLESFKKAFGRDPDILVTDQDPAMKQAIAAVFPNSRHRLCMWHIMQKVTSKVGPVLSSNDSFKKRLCGIVWTDKITVDYFEAKWASLINDFNLQENNRWFCDIFEIRFDWIPAYYVDEPMSGLMRTTSRSENENHFFGQLTSANLTLVEFLSHFETAMDAQRYAHARNDHDTRSTVPDTRTQLQIEVEAAKLFTRTIFLDVQEEIHASVMSCHSINVIQYETMMKCFIQEALDENDSTQGQAFKLYEVLFNQNEQTLLCKCKRYESYGLLCRHIFLVLRMFGVNEFPKKYVHKRWSKDALPPKHDGDMGHVNQRLERGNPIEAVIREVNSSVEYCVNKLVNDLDRLRLFHDQLKELMASTELNVPPPTMNMNKNSMLCSMLGVTEPAEITIQVPNGIRNKSCGSRKRFKSKVELASEQSSKPLRLCNFCNKRVRGHDSRNCPEKLKLVQQDGSSHNGSSSNKGKAIATNHDA